MTDPGEEPTPTEAEAFDASIVVLLLDTFNEMAADACEIGNEWMDAE